MIQRCSLSVLKSLSEQNTPSIETQNRSEQISGPVLHQKGITKIKCFQKAALY